MTLARRPGRRADHGARQPGRAPAGRLPRRWPTCRRASSVGACTADERPRRCGWERRASTRSSWSSARSRRPRSTTRQYFGDLDAVVGDGDFGYSLARGFEMVLADCDDFDRDRHRQRSCKKIAVVITCRDRRDVRAASGAPRSCAPGATAARQDRPRRATTWSRCCARRSRASRARAVRPRRQDAAGRARARPPTRSSSELAAGDERERARPDGGGHGPRDGRGDQGDARQARARRVHRRAQHRHGRRRRDRPSRSSSSRSADAWAADRLRGGG